MAEMENKTNEVIDVESTGLATTAPVQTEPENSTSKVGFFGKVCTGVAIVTGLASLLIKGYTKGKAKSAAKFSKEDNVVDEEPNSEDEVSE